MKSLIIALQTYSRIPLPQITWDEVGMRYAICFFPLVGVVVGGLEVLWFYLSMLLQINIIVFAVISAAIPLMVTGGIHMDGFCDTVDALSSHQSRERKLEILKDSHAGAFAIIFGGLYLIVYASSFTAIKNINHIILISIGFVLSRALSALAISFFKSATGKGMLYSFSKPADKNILKISSSAIIIICFASMIVIAGWLGAIVTVANILLFVFYKHVSYKQFGGITGDLAGWFLQLSELVTVLSAALFVNLF